MRTHKVFMVAGEHSGDALGANLMDALRAQSPTELVFAGVGGEQMEHRGLRSLFPLSDVAVMGPLSILPRLPRIVRRVYQTVNACLECDPDIVVIIDSPEFTHPIAKRIRQRKSDIPIVDYVSPSVWAWRPGRAKKMRPYVDHLMGILPFEPEAHHRLGGPPCTYVGHPMIEKLDWINSLDPAALAARLGLRAGAIPVVVLPGSRASEVTRLIDVFGATIDCLASRGLDVHVLLPTISHLRELVVDSTANWTVPVSMLDGDEDKFAAFKLARGALAASGTVTLELALVGTPMVVGYRVDPLAARLRFLVNVPSVVLANLVLGENVIPEFIQEECEVGGLCDALMDIVVEGDVRSLQLDALAKVASKMRLPHGTPSSAAASEVLKVIETKASTA
ncbi:MAG: lipid-A-disaccharide synthase [Hyphomicrobiaceae bacterium]